MDGKHILIFPKSAGTNKYSSISTGSFDILQNNGRAISSDIETVALWACNAKRIKGVGLRRVRVFINGQATIGELSATDILTHKYDIQSPLLYSDYPNRLASFSPRRVIDYDVEKGPFIGSSGVPTFPSPWSVFNEVINPFIHEDGFYFQKVLISSTATVDLTVNGATIEEFVDYLPNSSVVNDLKYTFTIEDTFD